ncbi:hypothetical protein NGB36_06845 [Streptomyces sp. RB6PN25]|uniref:Secreted protein n=1 Tax=Streptomyces humicola TaxID=2953240 RepID=A0ABT1PTN8_9ACTN|nr:hypothetical protein [Streptomyces humicola]MCQ4080320.1 hypothetical protein [Streptomyces humicola]
MFSRKKIAAVSGLLIGLAMTCAGVAQADDAGPSSGCTTDDQGNVTCMQQGQNNYTSKDGRNVVQQSRDCSTTYRQGSEAWPEVGVGQTGTTSTETGPAINCSNSYSQP